MSRETVAWVTGQPAFASASASSSWLPIRFRETTLAIKRCRSDFEREAAIGVFLFIPVGALDGRVGKSRHGLSGRRRKRAPSQRGPLHRSTVTPGLAESPSGNDPGMLRKL